MKHGDKMVKPGNLYQLTDFYKMETLTLIDLM